MSEPLTMQPADVLDRLSILILHRCRGDLKGTLPEYHAILNEATRLNDVLGDFVELLDTNRQIWDLEAAIRNGEELPLEEVGRRALEIRKLNGLRVNIKNQIMILMGGFIHVKVDHASA